MGCTGVLRGRKAQLKHILHRMLTGVPLVRLTLNSFIIHKPFKLYDSHGLGKYPMYNSLNITFFLWDLPEGHVVHVCLPSGIHFLGRDPTHTTIPIYPSPPLPLPPPLLESTLPLSMPTSPIPVSTHGPVSRHTLEPCHNPTHPCNL